MLRALQIATISISVTGRLPTSIFEIAVRSRESPSVCSRAANCSWVTFCPDPYRAARIRDPTIFLIAADIVVTKASRIVLCEHYLC